MTDGIRIEIVVGRDSRLEAFVPGDTQLKKLAADFFAILGWSDVDERGHPLLGVVKRINSSTWEEEEWLDNLATLNDVGIKDGDVLRILPRSLARGYRSLQDFPQPPLPGINLDDTEIQWGMAPLIGHPTNQERRRAVASITASVLANLNTQTSPSDQSAQRIDFKYINNLFRDHSDDPQFRCDVFMIMPFRDEYSFVYYLITTVVQGLGLEIKRGDDFQSPDGVIMDHIWSAIRHSKFVIAECTEVNANVYYELGLAHAQNIPAIVLTQNNETIPFDIKHRSYIKYKDSPESDRIFITQLAQHIEGLLRTLPDRDEPEGESE